MGRKKEKKVNVKKERYAKFRREKSTQVDINMPDLDDNQMRQKRTDEEKLEKYLRFNRNKPAKEIVDRKAKAKR